MPMARYTQGTFLPTNPCSSSGPTHTPISGRASSTLGFRVKSGASLDLPRAEALLPIASALPSTTRVRISPWPSPRTAQQGNAYARQVGSYRGGMVSDAPDLTLKPSVDEARPEIGVCV